MDATFSPATIISGLLGILLIIIGFLLQQGIGQLITTINKLEGTITRLFEKYDDHERRLSRLEGSHNERINAHTSCGE